MLTSDVRLTDYRDPNGEVGFGLSIILTDNTDASSASDSLPADGAIIQIDN